MYTHAQHTIHNYTRMQLRELRLPGKRNVVLSTGERVDYVMTYYLPKGVRRCRVPIPSRLPTLRVIFLLRLRPAAEVL